MSWRVWVQSDLERQRIRMAIIRDVGQDRREVFTPEGATLPIIAGEAIPDEAIFEWPEVAMPALEEAIRRFQGQASHGATEAAVLREWLEVEKARVDRFLGPQ